MANRRSVESWLNRNSSHEDDLAQLSQRGHAAVGSVTASFLLDDEDDDAGSAASETSTSSDSASSNSPHSLGHVEAGSSGTDGSVHRAAAQAAAAISPKHLSQEACAAPPADVDAPVQHLQPLQYSPGRELRLSPNALYTNSPLSASSSSTASLGAPFGLDETHRDRPSLERASSLSRRDHSPARQRPRLGPHRSSHAGRDGIHRRSLSSARQNVGTAPPLDSLHLASHSPLAPDLALSLDDLGISVADDGPRRPGPSVAHSPTRTPPLASAPFASTSSLRSPISPLRPSVGRSNSGRNSAISRRRSGARSAAAGAAILSTALPKKRAIAVGPQELARTAERLLALLSPASSPSTPRPYQRGGSVPLIVDVRPLPTFLKQHLRGSVNVSLPSLLMKRFRKGSTSAFSLESFLTTERSKRIFSRMLSRAQGRPGTLDGLDIYVIDSRLDERSATALTPGHSMGDVLCSVLERQRDGDFEQHGALYFLHGAFDDLLKEPSSLRLLVSEDEEHDVDLSSSSASPLVSPPRQTQDERERPAPKHLGLLALRQTPSQSALRGNAGGLRINTSPTTPTASTSSASPESGSSGASARRQRLKRLDTGDGLRTGGSSSAVSSEGRSEGLTIQTLVHQHKTSPVAPTFDFGHRKEGSDASTATLRDPGTPIHANDADAPFSVSTIIPGVLYLGPEPAKEDDVQALEALGIQRILNMAVEVADRPELRMHERFQKVERLPMRDFVDEQNVQTRIDEACAFLDDAGLHSKPAYVHCRAGKSRSVMIVLAFLIHRFRWPLKRAYAHVSERRPTASPNLGFVAELLRYEERELGVVKPSALGSSVPAPGSSLAGNRAPDAPPSSAMAGSLSSNGGGRVRESLPPAPAWQRATEREAEQEVKSSGGNWVFSHRPPLDGFVPTRRASKAGLESSRTL